MPIKVLIKNRKATFNYEILDKYEAGICLSGGEVKSIMAGSCSISESFINIIKKEVYIQQMHVSKYKNIDGFNTELSETRKRKLLLHKEEIKKLEKQTKIKGLTIIPLAIIYSNSRKIKVELAICRGKKVHDKREDIKKKDLKRDADRKGL